MVHELIVKTDGYWEPKGSTIRTQRSGQDDPE